MKNLAHAVLTEIARQHELHGPRAIGSKTNTDVERLSILMEEVGEVARAVNEQWDRPTRAELRTELIQVCACAWAWADAL